MEPLFQKSISIPADVLIREVRGESVILNLNSEAYIGLDEIGTRMFQVLKESETIQDAYELLLKEYDVAPDVLRRDLGRFIEKLVAHGIVELREA